MSSEPFRPARITPKPLVHGPQTAIVVGREKDEVCIDRHARVKVHFHWDRYDKRNEKSSCWLRVSQAWAGKGYGWLAIPRVGHEVIVDFLEGDPDRPIVTGRVYNGDNMPPISKAGKDIAHKPVQQHAGRGGVAAPQVQHAAGRAPKASGAAPSSTPAGEGTASRGAASPPLGGSSIESSAGLAHAGNGHDEGTLVRPSYSPLPPKVSGPMSQAQTSVGLIAGMPTTSPKPGGSYSPTVEPALPRSVTETAQHTTFKSDSLDGADGSNEITINDSGSKEGLFFHAQYNEVHVVGNDRIDQVGKNAMLSTGENKVEDIGLSAQETIGVAKVVDVGTTLLIKAGTSITFQCGASMIHMNQAGFITISGTVINIAGAANCNMAAPITSVTGGLLMMSNGMLNMVNGGFLTNVNSGGKAAVKAGGDALVQGAKVKLN